MPCHEKDRARMSEVDMNLSSDNVQTIFMDCLYRDDEINGGAPPDGAILVEGIVGKYGLHPARINSHKDEIKTMLTELPSAFKEGSGGGWSFLNACMTESGKQWTDEHRIMEQLFVLGMASGLVKNLLPREIWGSLPGGVPYYMIVA